MRVAKLQIPLIIGCLTLLMPAHACLWDKDTLATEAKGLPGVVEVITGRFERNPPLYYEMRLARVAREIKTQPSKLELYDDAGVACDRLHNGGGAVAWMKQKRSQLKPYPQDKEHWYRYHANLGTFLAHDWLRNGANRKNLGEMKEARDHIAQAIKINPNAHFGREKVQLAAMEWIIKPPKKEWLVPDFFDFVDQGDNSVSEKPKTQRATIEGLRGLIVLGAAWESVDVYWTLVLALKLDQETSVAHLAQLRIKELQNSGHHSLYPGVTAADEEMMINARALFLTPNIDRDYKQTDAVYADLRKEADAWQARRTEYMMERLRAGRHPDTDKDFWSQWRDSGPPPIPEFLSPAELKARLLDMMLFGVGVFVALLSIAAIWQRTRKSSQVL